MIDPRMTYEEPLETFPAVDPTVSPGLLEYVQAIQEAVPGVEVKYVPWNQWHYDANRMEYDTARFYFPGSRYYAATVCYGRISKTAIEFHSRLVRTGVEWKTATVGFFRNTLRIRSPKKAKELVSGLVKDYSILEIAELYVETARCGPIRSYLDKLEQVVQYRASDVAYATRCGPDELLDWLETGSCPERVADALKEYKAAKELFGFQRERWAVPVVVLHHGGMVHVVIGENVMSYNSLEDVDEDIAGRVAVMAQMRWFKFDPDMGCFIDTDAWITYG